MIERAGSHAHDRAVRVRSRVRRFLEPEHAGTTVFVKANAEHGTILETRATLRHAHVRDVAEIERLQRAGQLVAVADDDAHEP